MAVTWGPGEGSGFGIFYVGIDYSVSGTTATVRYYVRTEANSVNDSQTLTLTGKITGTVNFSMTTPNMGAQLVATRTFSGSRGSNYTVGASLSGTYSGGTPSHSRSVPIPATVPSTPGTPSVSSITNSSVRLSWSHPSNNGSTLLEYQIQVDNNSNYSSPIRDYDGVTGTSETVTGLPGNTTQYTRIRVRNAIGWSNWSGSRSFKSKPDAPATPDSGSTARTSDTQQVFSWDRNNTTEGPYDNQYVERWTNTTGTYAARATLSGSPESYTDTGTVANRRYRYRVRAKNASGYSGYETSSNYISTTPAAPTGITATKTGSNIVVKWTNAATHFQQVEIWHAANGVWDGSPLTTLNTTSATTYTHVAPNASVTHTYRLRARQNVDSPTLTSAYSSNSNVVQLLTAPATPTPLTPADGSVVVDTGSGDVTLTWQHNPIDTTEQTKYEVQYRPSSDPTWISSGEIASTVSSHVLPGLDHAETWLWRVRTWGDYVNPSPFNTSTTFTISSPPTVSWVSPTDSAVINIASISGEWFFSDPESGEQAGWQVELWEGETRVELKSGSGTDSTVVMDTQLKNLVTYELRVRVQDQATLWSDWVSVEFSTDFAKPAGAELQATYFTENGTLGITITNLEDVLLPATIYNEVWVAEGPIMNELYETWQQAVADGDPGQIAQALTNLESGWLTYATLLETNLELNTTITYSLPRLGVESFYRVITASDLPSYTESPIYAFMTAPVEGWLFINGGQDFHDWARLRAELKIGRSQKRDKAFNRYKGRRLPVRTTGEGITHAISISAKIRPTNRPEPSSSADEIVELALGAGDTYIRDPLGHKWLVAIETAEPEYYGLYEGINFSGQEVEG